MGAFTEGITGEELKAVGAGEVNEFYPSAQSTYTTFEDGISEGRFVKLDSDSLDALDGSTTPTLAGVLLRDITGNAIESEGLTDTDVQTSVQVLEDGFVTVDVTDTAVPTKLSQVYYINAETDSGKTTQDSTETGATALDAYFVREVKTGVWLIKINKIAGA